jgi:hypothetical protein
MERNELPTVMRNIFGGSGKSRLHPGEASRRQRSFLMA